jgi:glycosyltransferase involved in cell wall biosynthesis
VKVLVGAGGRFHMPWVADALAAELGSDLVVASGRVTRSGFQAAGQVHVNLMPNLLRRAHTLVPGLRRVRHPSEVWDPTIGRWLARRAYSLQPDVLHVWSAYALEAFREPGNAVRVLENGSFHPLHDLQMLGQLAPSALRRRSWIERLKAEYELADVILVPTEAIAQSLHDYGVSHDRIRVLPYGVAPLFAEDSASASARDIALLFVGNLGYQKGIDLIIRCIAEGVVGAEQLIVVGRRVRHQEGYLRQLRAMGVRCIEHLDQRSLASVYARSRWIVIPSRQDGTPLVCLEAMSAGCVPLISSGAGLSSMVANLDRRLVVEAGDGEGLAKRLREILTWPGERWRHLSTNAAAMTSEFSWARYARHCVSIYGELIARMRRPIAP